MLGLDGNSVWGSFDGLGMWLKLSFGFGGRLKVCCGFVGRNIMKHK